MTAPAPTPARARPDGPGGERRGFWLAAAVMTVSIAVLLALFVAVYPDDGTGGEPPPSTTGRVQNAPSIIPKPGEGRAPDDPSDPGGWKQLALLGLVVGGMATVGGLAWRSSRRARAADRGPTALS